MKVYQYPRCSTCRAALKWLDAHGIQYTSVDITQSPPSKRALAEVLKRTGLSITKLFNTSGQSYREGGFKAKLPSMTEEQALAALAADGKLIKRPLLISDEFTLVGFKPAEYEQRFG